MNLAGWRSTVDAIQWHQRRGHDSGPDLDRECAASERRLMALDARRRYAHARRVRERL